MSTDLDPFDLVTIQQAADLLGLNHVTVCRQIAAGRIPVERLGPRALRVKRADVASLLAPVPTAVGR